MKSFGLTETKLYHFHRIFKNRGRGGGFKQTSYGSTTRIKITNYICLVETKMIKYVLLH